MVATLANGNRLAIPSLRLDKHVSEGQVNPALWNHKETLIKKKSKVDDLSTLLFDLHGNFPSFSSRRANFVEEYQSDWSGATCLWYYQRLRQNAAHDIQTLAAHPFSQLGKISAFLLVFI
jgi:hypothetical protein